MSLPETPHTRRNLYLSVISGQNSVDDLPDNPLTEEERYLDYIARNGGSGGGSGLSVSLYRYGDLVKKEAVASGTVITLPSVESYTNWEFAGWSTTKGATTAPDYAAGDTITVTADVTLYAVFRKYVSTNYILDHEDKVNMVDSSAGMGTDEVFENTVTFDADWDKISVRAEYWYAQLNGRPTKGQDIDPTQFKDSLSGIVDDSTNPPTYYDPYAIAIKHNNAYVRPSEIYDAKENETITIQVHYKYQSKSSHTWYTAYVGYYTEVVTYVYTQEFHAMTLKSFTYTGTGSVPNQITFPETPSMVMGISNAFERDGNEVAQGCVPFVWGEKAMYMYWSNSTGSESLAGSHYTHLSYNGNVLTISIAGNDGGAVMNIANVTYTVYYV